MKQYILLFGLLFFVSIGVAQVLIGAPETKGKAEKKKTEKPKELKFVPLSELGTRVYLTANWSNSFRSLSENGPLYGDPLGKRADEKAAQVWSYCLGIQNDLTKHVFWDAGIAYVQNGEDYSYVASDSTYSYQTRYHYISMPLKVNFKVQKNRFHFYAGIGLLPQMYVSSKRTINWQVNNESAKELTEGLSEKTTPFCVSGLLNLGLMIDFNKGFSLLISPEMRVQFNSSFDQYQSYIHKNQAYGISFGLTKKM